MRRDITGRRVKLRRSAKRILGRAHFREFAHQRGTARRFGDWPEWEVLWDSGLRYLYKRDWLDLV